MRASFVSEVQIFRFYYSSSVSLFMTCYMKTKWICKSAIPQKDLLRIGDPYVGDEDDNNLQNTGDSGVVLLGEEI